MLLSALLNLRRNPNYLGECFIYYSFAMMTRSAWSFYLLSIYWLCFFWPNMVWICQDYLTVTRWRRMPPYLDIQAGLTTVKSRDFSCQKVTTCFERIWPLTRTHWIEWWILALSSSFNCYCTAASYLILKRLINSLVRLRFARINFSGVLREKKTHDEQERNKEN